jgi:hypothetical protein
MNHHIGYVSEEWLRAHVYTQGKESQDESQSATDRFPRLAEARATLLDWRGHWLADSPDTEP